jgi:hypothetical protein
MRLGLCALAVGLISGVIFAAAGGERNRSLSERFVKWTDHPAIRYHETNTSDPVARLIEDVAGGRVQLRRNGPSGYLRSVLDALHISVDSQIMVFAKDSVQASRISAMNPRALFFNNAAVVGWVRGGFIELASQDPKQGVIFYSLKESIIGAPSFARNDAGCLSCHYSFSSVGVPGMLARSFLQYNVTDRTPFEKRWGGWYVTGQGGGPHLGNIDLAHLADVPPPAGTLNWSSLENKFDTAGYLAPQSDLVALLVFEHQMQMMNLLTRIGWEARVLDFRRGKTDDQLRASGDDPSDQTASLEDAAQEVVDYMLFVEEAPLRGPIRGATDFAAQFTSQGPRDHKGRSLRELDLHTRLLTHPCSYMIYSAQFEQLPVAAKDAIYRRMWQVLSGQEHDPAYARLTPESRAAIVEILRDTKPNLPSYFRPPRPR